MLDNLGDRLSFVEQQKLDMDGHTARSIESLSDIDSVYSDESFDSLAQVMQLLRPTDSSPEDARKGLEAQLAIANRVFDALVEDNHERVLENAVRHGEALDLYRVMSSGLRQLVVEVDEARRAMRPIASDSLMQLRYKRAVLSDVTGILHSVSQLQTMPQEIQELLVQGSIVDASQKVIKGVDLALREDIGSLAPLEPTRKQLLNLRETCYSAIIGEVKRLVYGYESDARNKGRTVADWQQAADQLQRSLLSALDTLQQFGPHYMIRARAELVSSLRPELLRCCEMVESGTSDGGWGGRGVGAGGTGFAAQGGTAARVDRLFRVFDHLRLVVRMHVFVSLTLGAGAGAGAADDTSARQSGGVAIEGDAGKEKETSERSREVEELARTYTMAFVWEAVQLQVRVVCLCVWGGGCAAAGARGILRCLCWLFM